MLQVLSKEFNGFLNSLIAYIVIGVFLTAIGLLMWVFPDTAVLDYGYADMDTLFLMGPYVFIFLVPAITMRTFAEEKKAGTIELLLTKPVTDWVLFFEVFRELSFGHFCTSAYVCCITTRFMFLEIRRETSIHPGDRFIHRLAFLAAVFCAIGIFASSTHTQSNRSFLSCGVPVLSCLAWI